MVSDLVDLGSLFVLTTGLMLHDCRNSSTCVAVAARSFNKLAQLDYMFFFI